MFYCCQMFLDVLIEHVFVLFIHIWYLLDGSYLQNFHPQSSRSGTKKKNDAVQKEPQGVDGTEVENKDTYPPWN